MDARLAGWLVATSGLALLAAGWDKLAARRGARRVPEATLLGLALAGGSLGLLLGMALFRHKLRKPGFVAGVAVIVALQAAAAFVLL